jgi:hypothetical protein
MEIDKDGGVRESSHVSPSLRWVMALRYNFGMMFL